MVTSDFFFVIFFATILITRLLLFIKPIPSPTVGHFRIHHYMYGVVLIMIGLIFHSVLLFAIGFGLFIDELTYLLMKGKNHEDNYSKVSLVGTLIFIILVFLLKDYLVILFR